MPRQSTCRKALLKGPIGVPCGAELYSTRRSWGAKLSPHNKVGALHPCVIPLPAIASFPVAPSQLRVPARRRVTSADFWCPLHGKAKLSLCASRPSGRVCRPVAVACVLRCHHRAALRSGWGRAEWVSGFRSWGVGCGLAFPAFSQRRAACIVWFVLRPVAVVRCRVRLRHHRSARISFLFRCRVVRRCYRSSRGASWATLPQHCAPGDAAR